MNSTGKFIMLLGIVIFIAGLIWYLFGNKLNWLGHLPGDIRIEKENFRFYFPVTTMIILSVVLSLLIGILRKLF